MRLAGRELRRRPRAFLVATGILVLLAVLLLYPSAILDGILDGSTAAVRHAPADLLVYSRDANGMQVRSRLEPADRRQVEATPGVEQAAGFDAYAFTGMVEDETESVPLAVLSSDAALGGAEPAPGEAVVEGRLRDQVDVELGDQILLGPFREPVTVVAFTEDIGLWLLPGVVVDRSTWLGALGNQAAADAPGAQEAAQVLLVEVEAGAKPETVAAAIDEASGGLTETFTKQQAIEAMPGVAEQESTFGYMRLVTLGVALVVVGLFLSFMTLERTPLYAVLKALGASSRQLFAGVVLQALSITAVAVIVASLCTWGLTRIPLELPTEMHPARLLQTLVALAVTACAGSILSLRRVMRVEPASAVG